MKVVNVQTTHFKTKEKDNYVYIGRGSKWGNPFVIGKHGTRDEVIKQYKRYLWESKELMGSLEELDGKTLGCFCSPQKCHGDVLIAARKWQLSHCHECNKAVPKTKEEFNNGHTCDCYYYF